MIRLPRQVALVLEAFPASVWAPQLVNAVNQFALEVVQAFRFAIPNYKVLDFSTSNDVTASFPIDFPVAATPVDVRVAAAISGDNGYEALSVKWAPIVGNGSSLNVRVNYITGLSANTSYSIRLAYQ